MAYSEWQKDTIRRALNRYQYNAGQNGSALKLTRVHELMLLSHSANATYEFSMEYEALRRFLKGETKTNSHDLGAIANFLIAQKYLTEKDLDPEVAELGEILAVQAHLANFDSEAKALIAQIQPDYHARLRTSYCDDEITIRTLINESGCFFKVEEFFERFAFPGADWPESGKTGDSRKIAVRRKGYGFVSTPRNLIYVFLRGADPNDRVIYVQAWPSERKFSPEEFYVLRSGDEMIERQYSPVGRSGTVEMENVYGFVSTKSVPRWRTVK